MLKSLAGVAIALLGPAHAQIAVTADIVTSTQWTAGNVYDLQAQVFVRPGATLTIEPGVVIASTTGFGGSLTVARGAQIHVLGEAHAPVIMTSSADRATWPGGDPKGGTWREAANEWGNLTILGSGYISSDAEPGNVPTPSASNLAVMPGLVPQFPGDPDVRYGGGDDDDDSGTIRYLSLRYGGRVIGLANELPGLALGGVGRSTEIDHVEVMNGVDDGVRLLGGAVNLRHISVWNVGDDSLDIDEGWRGKAQFGLIVQGHCIDASQGSGVGDNAIEIDGARAPDWQPVTTSTIRNFTIIGQPIDGDGLTAWRNNARVQFRNCIFMDGGEQVVRLDDTGLGTNYGLNGTLTWPQTWQAPASSTSTVNAPPNPGDFYAAQTSGNLIEFTGNVFFRNLAGNAYTEANARGVFAPGGSNILGLNLSTEPIRSIVRSSAVVRGGKTLLPVASLDPRPANDALTNTTEAPTDGFFSPAGYRGAFSPDTETTWLCGWSAAEAFGFLVGDCTGFVEAACEPAPNSSGITGSLRASGSGILAQNNVTLEATDLPANSPGYFIVSRSPGGPAQPIANSGILCLGGAIGRYVGPGQIGFSGAARTITLGVDLLAIPQPNGFEAATTGETWRFQLWHRDTLGGATTSNFTNALAVQVR